MKVGRLSHLSKSSQQFGDRAMPAIQVLRLFPSAHSKGQSHHLISDCGKGPLSQKQPQGGGKFMGGPVVTADSYLMTV